MTTSTAPLAARRAAAAADAAAPPRLRPRGSNQVGMRQFNERVVLHAIRLHGAMAQAEIARLTHLTAQTVSLIMARLERDDLLLRLPPIRGRVGQPSVPIALNPDGAFAIGVKIGRRGLDALLVDFTGSVRERHAMAYDFPDPATLFGDIGRSLKALRKTLPPALRKRLQGVGVAAPLSLGGWQELLGFAPTLATAWQPIDIRARVAALTDLPVSFVKDTAAACVAELVAGRGRNVRSFLYVFVDTFIGGGLVLDSHLRGGVNGNAGAVGSLPMGLDAACRDRGEECGKGGGAPASARAQLLGSASLWNLEALYAAAGLAPQAWLDERALRMPWQPHTRRWLDEAAPAIAMALNSAACLLDIESAIIDGSFGRELLGALLADVEQALDLYNWEGVARPALMAGTIGSDARALGGALMPLYAQFAPDRDLFLKLDP